MCAAVRDGQALRARELEEAGELETHLQLLERLALALPRVFGLDAVVAGPAVERLLPHLVPHDDAQLLLGQRREPRPRRRTCAACRTERAYSSRVEDGPGVVATGEEVREGDGPVRVDDVDHAGGREVEAALARGRVAGSEEGVQVGGRAEVD